MRVTLLKIKFKNKILNNDKLGFTKERKSFALKIFKKCIYATLEWK